MLLVKILVQNRQLRGNHVQLAVGLVKEKANPVLIKNLCAGDILQINLIKGVSLIAFQGIKGVFDIVNRYRAAVGKPGLFIQGKVTDRPSSAGEISLAIRP